jgi:hypothetical protein
LSTKNAIGSSQASSEFVFGAALKDPSPFGNGFGASSAPPSSNTTESKYAGSSFRNPRK